jgi:gamma-glutamylcyclotransferase (GGCT)/AIG2-like uncharacterized protein YtfP
MLLNYFEFVIHLEREGHLKQSDQRAVFEYWFDLMAKKKRAAVRRYVANFGFKRVAPALGCEEADYVAFYGSLMQQGATDEQPDWSPHLRYVGKGALEGSLIDLGDYPGLIPGDGKVIGEIYEVVKRDGEVLGHKVFKAMDDFERYDAGNPVNSLFVRRTVRLLDPPNRDAWVYVYNGDASSAPPVAGGDWSRHQMARVKA